MSKAISSPKKASWLLLNIRKVVLGIGAFNFLLILVLQPWLHKSLSLLSYFWADTVFTAVAYFFAPDKEIIEGDRVVARWHLGFTLFLTCFLLFGYKIDMVLRALL